MVEGCPFHPNALVGERLQERHQRRFVVCTQAQVLDPATQHSCVLLGEVPTAAVEVHHLFQRGHAAVVHVRPGEFYVPETGCLEGALRARRVSCREGQVERPDRGTDAQVVVDAANTRVEESGVATADETDRKSTRLNSSHGYISYAVFCL